MAKTIMIISPHTQQRNALERLLQGAGYEVAPGVSKLNALRHALDASETRPEIILVDYWLSQANTLELIRRLKGQGFSVILMGNKALCQEVAESLKIPLIPKPFTTSELLQSIK